MDWDLKYGELANDKEYVCKCERLKQNLIDLKVVMDQLLPLKAHYDKMSLPAQIELDLFLAFTLNSLQWVHMRIMGKDPSKHAIKEELLRVKKAMMKWQEVKDEDGRPMVDVETAKRFIRSGLYDPYKAIGQPQSKKFKFCDEM